MVKQYWSKAEGWILDGSRILLAVATVVSLGYGIVVGLDVLSKINASPDFTEDDGIKQVMFDPPSIKNAEMEVAEEAETEPAQPEKTELESQREEYGRYKDEVDDMVAALRPFFDLDETPEFTASQLERYCYLLIDRLWVPIEEHISVDVDRIELLDDAVDGLVEYAGGFVDFYGGEVGLVYSSGIGKATKPILPAFAAHLRGYGFGNNEHPPLLYYVQSHGEAIIALKQDARAEMENVERRKSAGQLQLIHLGIVAIAFVLAAFMFLMLKLEANLRGQRGGPDAMMRG